MLIWKIVSFSLIMHEASINADLLNHTHPLFSHGDVTDEYGKALPLLSALVQTDKYSQAGVWLKYAECQHMLNDLEAAAASYSKVITLAPNHTDTRFG